MAMDNGAESNLFWVVSLEDRPHFVIPDIWMWRKKRMCLLPNGEQQAGIETEARMRTPPGENWISRKITETYGPYGTYDQAMGECEHLGENSDSDTEDERNSVLGSTSHEPNVAVENPERVRSPIPASTSPITSINESDDSIRSTPRTQDPVASESNERDIRGLETALQDLELPSQIAQSNDQSVGNSGETRFDNSFPLTSAEAVMALENLITRDTRKAGELEEFFTTVFEKSKEDILRQGSRLTLPDTVRRSLDRIFTDNATTFHDWANVDESKLTIRRMEIFIVLYKALGRVFTRPKRYIFVSHVQDWMRRAAERQADSASRNPVAEN
nr:uncharacterized protein LOC124213530 [Neodiprion pinetum]